MSGKHIVNSDTHSGEIHMKQDTTEAIVKPVKKGHNEILIRSKISYILLANTSVATRNMISLSLYFPVTKGSTESFKHGKKRRERGKKNNMRKISVVSTAHVRACECSVRKQNV